MFYNVLRTLSDIEWNGIKRNETLHNKTKRNETKEIIWFNEIDNIPIEMISA